MPYLGVRKILSHELEDMKVAPPKQAVLTDQQLDDLHREDVENFYQRIKNGWIPNSIPEYFHCILIKDGLMKHGESITDFFVTRLGKGFANIYVKEKYGV